MREVISVFAALFSVNILILLVDCNAVQNNDDQIARTLRRARSTEGGALSSFSTKSTNNNGIDEYNDDPSKWKSMEQDALNVPVDQIRKQRVRRLQEEFPNCKILRFDYLGDGHCDRVGNYNTAACGWDGGDCCEETCPEGVRYSCQTKWMQCKDPKVLYSDCPFLNDRKLTKYLGDGFCDKTPSENLNIAECGWDGGDCCEESCSSGPLYKCGTLGETGTGGYQCLDPNYNNSNNDDPEEDTTSTATPTSSIQVTSAPTPSPPTAAPTPQPTGSPEESVVEAVPKPTPVANPTKEEEQDSVSNDKENNNNNINDDKENQKDQDQDGVNTNDTDKEEQNEDNANNETNKETDTTDEKNGERISIELNPFVLSLLLSSEAPFLQNPGYELEWNDFTKHTSEYLTQTLKERNNNDDPSGVLWSLQQNGGTDASSSSFQKAQLTVVASRITMESLQDSRGNDRRTLQDNGASNGDIVATKGDVGSVLHVALRGHADFLVSSTDSANSRVVDSDQLKAAIMDAFFVGGGEPYVSYLDAGFSTGDSDQKMNLNSWLVFSNIVGVGGFDFVDTNNGTGNQGSIDDSSSSFSDEGTLDDNDKKRNKGGAIAGILIMLILLAFLIGFLVMKRDLVRTYVVQQRQKMRERKHQKDKTENSNNNSDPLDDLEEDTNPKDKDTNGTSPPSSFRTSPARSFLSSSNSFDAGDHTNKQQQHVHGGQTSSIMKADGDNDDAMAQTQPHPTLHEIGPMNSFEIVGLQPPATDMEDGTGHIRQRSLVPPPPPPIMTIDTANNDASTPNTPSPLKSPETSLPQREQQQHRLSMPERALRKLADTGRRNFSIFALPWNNMGLAGIMTNNNNNSNSDTIDVKTGAGTANAAPEGGGAIAQGGRGGTTSNEHNQEEDVIEQDSVIFQMNSFDTYGDFSYTYSIAGNTVQSNYPPPRAKASGRPKQHTSTSNASTTLSSSTISGGAAGTAINSASSILRRQPLSQSTATAVASNTNEPAAVITPPKVANENNNDDCNEEDKITELRPSSSLSSKDGETLSSTPVPLKRQGNSNLSFKSQSTTESGAEFREIQESIKALDATLTKLEQCATEEEQQQMMMMNHQHHQQHQQHFDHAMFNTNGSGSIVLLDQNTSPSRSLCTNPSFGVLNGGGTMMDDNASIFTYTGIATPSPTTTNVSPNNRAFVGRPSPSSGQQRWSNGKIVYTEHHRIESTLTQSFSYEESDAIIVPPPTTIRSSTSNHHVPAPAYISPPTPRVTKEAVVSPMYNETDQDKRHSIFARGPSKKENPYHDGGIGGGSNPPGDFANMTLKDQMMAPPAYTLNPTSSGVTIKMANSYEQRGGSFDDSTINDDDHESFDPFRNTAAAYLATTGGGGEPNAKAAIPSKTQRSVSDCHLYKQDNAGKQHIMDEDDEQQEGTGVSRPITLQKSKSGVKKLVRSLSKTLTNNSISKRPSLIKRHNSSSSALHSRQKSLPVYSVEIPKVAPPPTHDRSISTMGQIGLSSLDSMKNLTTSGTKHHDGGDGTVLPLQDSNYHGGASYNRTTQSDHGMETSTAAFPDLLHSTEKMNPTMVSSSTSPTKDSPFGQGEGGEFTTQAQPPQKENVSMQQPQKQAEDHSSPPMIKRSHSYQQDHANFQVMERNGSFEVYDSTASAEFAAASTDDEEEDEAFRSSTNNSTSTKKNNLILSHSNPQQQDIRFSPPTIPPPPPRRRPSNTQNDRLPFSMSHDSYDDVSIPMDGHDI